jgi:hypothetical protein
VIIPQTHPPMQPTISQIVGAACPYLIGRFIICVG